MLDLSWFAVPKLAETSVFLRLFLLFLSGMLGAFGILVGLLIIHTHLATVRSYGVRRA